MVSQQRSGRLKTPDSRPTSKKNLRVWLVRAEAAHIAAKAGVPSCINPVSPIKFRDCANVENPIFFYYNTCFNTFCNRCCGTLEKFTEVEELYCANHNWPKVYGPNFKVSMEGAQKFGCTLAWSSQTLTFELQLNQIYFPPQRQKEGTESSSDCVHT